eukprot:superscaffoldBa00010667_g24829
MQRFLQVITSKPSVCVAARRRKCDGLGIFSGSRVGDLDPESDHSILQSHPNPQNPQNPQNLQNLVQTVYVSKSDRK